jgi:hypothetical protein
MAPDQGGAAQRDAWICFLDESGVSLRPPVRRTWAPRGQTPIVGHHGHWKRASMAGICCYAPDGSRARLCFHAQPDSYNDHTLIEVLLAACRSEQGIPDAVLSSDDYGSRLERPAKRHLLWRVFSAYQASDAVHQWRTLGVTLGVQGLSPVGGCGGCPVAVASGHD